MGGGEVLETFLNEAKDLLEQLEAALLDLESRPDDRELVNTTFRALHTLKGSGGMFGPADMAAFAHELENGFERVRQGQAPMTPSLANVLLASTDHIRRLLFEPGGGHGAESERLVALLKAEVAGDAPGPSRPGTASGAPPAPPPTPPAAAAKRRFAVTLRLPPKALAFGTNPIGLIDEVAELGPVAVTVLDDKLPPLERMSAGDLYLGWRIELETEATRAAIEDVFIFVDEPGALAIEELDPPAARAEAGDAAPLPTAAPAASAPPPAPAAPAKRKPDAPAAEARPAERADNHVRVSAQRLDTLLDQVGELVIAQARLSALARAGRDPALTAVVEEIERLSADLRDSAMDMRMLPIDSLFSRYRRVVRDLSGELGKEIDFILSGEETELDKTVLDRLGDPLVHIIRNSIDHGIEDAARREAAGKPKRGSLRLGARQSGTEVVITVEDDGAGLNRARILEKAIAAGLVPDGTTPPEREIDELIFHPGLSTAASVSNLSGRGVGMDVVKRTINELHGTIEIETEPGYGTKFMLRLPLTLAIIDGLQVQIGTAPCILPLSSVEECVELSALKSKTSSGRNFVDIRGTIVPLLWMSEVFGTARPGSVVVVVASDTGRIGVVVDQVIGQHQTVIKPLSPLHRSTPGLAGATILGDGSVALILDVNPLARRSAMARPDGQRQAA